MEMFYRYLRGYEYNAINLYIKMIDSYKALQKYRLLQK